MKIEEDLAVDRKSQAAAFRDSLNGKRIEPGKSVINFGEGKWNEKDQKSLKTILSKTELQTDGRAERHHFPKHLN